MTRPVLFRKRYIPDEIVELKNDILCHRDDTMLITSWIPIKPRQDMAGGVSLYLPDKSWKISRIHDINGKFHHYYCDIIHTDYYEEKDTFIFTDLLADVAVFPDGRYTVLDLDELAEAFEQHLIDQSLVCEALRAVHELIRTIEHGHFEEYTRYIEKYEVPHPVKES